MSIYFRTVTNAYNCLPNGAGCYDGVCNNASSDCNTGGDHNACAYFNSCVTTGCLAFGR